MKPVNEFHLYGTLPTFTCPGCHNAHSARTCSTCGYRLDRAEMVALLGLTETEADYFARRLT